ncbi:dTDP-4-dehydrorhamnose 3,5-epimerase [Pseudomonas sp. NPDC087697]|uniref:dTDP-4-dehydrorhamnose 3,5-epimerase n=1 Tax=Pseudomonas sp. NPDC087697 TaxID=3364447 RepID=UPI003808F337
MRLLQTSLPDVAILEPAIYEDSQGCSMQSFDEPAFHRALKTAGLPVPRSLIQDNYFCSKKGVLRGLHYQLPPHAQGNLIRVVNGSAYIAVVDVRRDSLTFGKWLGIELDAVSQRMLWVPEGFAHGFVALEDNTHFFYKTTNGHHKESERNVRWNDPGLGIGWPKFTEITIGTKDAVAPLLKNSEPHSEFLQGTTELMDLKVIGDNRGSLIALEQGLNIPFAIKRVYYIYDTLSDVGRGFHAHRRLEQMAICVSGNCKIVIDDGVTRQQISLDSASKALIMRNMIWREMHEFSDDCVLLVLASEPYDESDYIRDYDQFIKEVSDGKK